MQKRRPIPLYLSVLANLDVSVSLNYTDYTVFKNCWFPCLEDGAQAQFSTACERAWWTKGHFSGLLHQSDQMFMS